MQFTQQTDYALRILMYAGSNPERLVNITEIAQFYDISRSHLTKIVANLSNTGYLESIRGHKGGLRLNRDAKEINIGEVIRQFEPLSIVDCMGDSRHCMINENCLLKGLFQKATENFLKTFDVFSLSDVINNKALQNQFLHFLLKTI